MAVKTRERERIAPAPAGSAVEGLPGGLLRAGYLHRAAHDRSQRSERSVARRLALVGFAKAFASEQEDFGVFHQAVGDGRGHGGIEKDVAPLGERSVGSDDRALVLTIAGGDHLIEEVRGLPIQRDIS